MVSNKHLWIIHHQHYFVFLLGLMASNSESNLSFKISYFILHKEWEVWYQPIASSIQFLKSTQASKGFLLP